MTGLPWWSDNAIVSLSKGKKKDKEEEKRNNLQKWTENAYMKPTMAFENISIKNLVLNSSIIHSSQCLRFIIGALFIVSLCKNQIFVKYKCKQGVEESFYTDWRLNTLFDFLQKVTLDKRHLSLLKGQKWKETTFRLNILRLLVIISLLVIMGRNDKPWKQWVGKVHTLCSV